MNKTNQKLNISRRHLNRLARIRLNKDNVQKIINAENLSKCSNNNKTSADSSSLIPQLNPKLLNQVRNNHQSSSSSSCKCNLIYQESKLKILKLKLIVAKQSVMLERLIKYMDDPSYIGNWVKFPIKSEKELLDFEEKLKIDILHSSMIIVLSKNIEKPQSVTKIMKSMFDDEYIITYNFDGIFGKKKFSDLNIYRTLKDAWIKTGNEEMDLEHKIRKCFRISRTRLLRK